MQDGAFGMRPDATVLTPDVRALLIADAKWKQLDRSTANIGVSRNDIYRWQPMLPATAVLTSRSSIL